VTHPPASATEVDAPGSTPLRTGAGFAVALVVMNVGTYAFTVLAARVLGPEEYGALGSLMGVLVVVNVVSLGLQATGARRVAADPAERPAIEAAVLAATHRCAAALTAVCLLLSPLAVVGLDVGVPTAVAVALTAYPLTLVGGWAGVLQGEQRWAPLAGVYLGLGLGRLVVGGAAVLLVPSVLAGVVGVALGALVPLAVGVLALRRREAAVPGGSTPTGQHGARALLREVGSSSQALLAFFALTSTDVVVARAVLDPVDAGLYAAGLVVTKAVLFLPQFVVVLAFPAMARRDTGPRLAPGPLLLVAALGLAATGATAVLSDLALAFVGGDAYAGVRPLLWAFAALGTLHALVQLVVYAVVAGHRRRSTAVPWVALAVLAVVAPLAPTVGALLAVTAAVQAVVLVVLLVVVLRPRG